MDRQCQNVKWRASICVLFSLKNMHRLELSILISHSTMILIIDIHSNHHAVQCSQHYDNQIKIFIVLYDFPCHNYNKLSFWEKALSLMTPFVYSWQLQRSCICLFSYTFHYVETLQTWHFYHILAFLCLDVSTISAGENNIPYFPLVLTFVVILHLSYYFTYGVQLQCYEQNNYYYLDICRGPALVI